MNAALVTGTTRADSQRMRPLMHREMRARLSLLLVLALAAPPVALADGTPTASRASRVQTWVRRTASNVRNRVVRAASGARHTATQTAVRVGAVGALTASQAHADTFSRVAVAIGAPPEVLVGGAVVVGLAARRIVRNRRRDARAQHRTDVGAFDQSPIGRSYKAAFAAAQNGSATEGQQLVEVSEAMLRANETGPDATLWRVTRALGLIARSPSPEGFAARMSSNAPSDGQGSSDRDAELIEDLSKAVFDDTFHMTEIESAIRSLGAALQVRPGIGRERNTQRQVARAERVLSNHKMSASRRAQQLSVVRTRALQRIQRNPR